MCVCVCVEKDFGASMCSYSEGGGRIGWHGGECGFCQCRRARSGRRSLTEHMGNEGKKACCSRQEEKRNEK